MARTNKTGIDYFPRCNPHINTASKLGSSNPKVRYKAYRNISSGFINRKDVRRIVMGECDSKCVLCGSSDRLEIDHVISVYRAYIDRMSIHDLNSKYNLQVLCKSCNSSKSPNK